MTLVCCHHQSCGNEDNVVPALKSPFLSWEIWERKKVNVSRWMSSHRSQPCKLVCGHGSKVRTGVEVSLQKIMFQLWSGKEGRGWCYSLDIKYPRRTCIIKYLISSWHIMMGCSRTFGRPSWMKCIIQGRPCIYVAWLHLLLRSSATWSA